MTRHVYFTSGDHLKLVWQLWQANYRTCPKFHNRYLNLKMFIGVVNGLERLQNFTWRLTSGAVRFPGGCHCLEQKKSPGTEWNRRLTGS